MRPFLSGFYERRREVRRYLAVLIRSERMAEKNGARGKHEREFRMARAAAMLILYNMIEASARSSIQAIYDEITNTKTPFDALRATLRKRILKDFKNNFGMVRSDTIKSIAYQLVDASFDSRRLFSGNVDAREIRQQAVDYGFAVDTDYSRTKHGEDLLVIKNLRNDLAHGILSFSDVGRDYIATDILKISRSSLCYMEDILLKINEYLDKMQYCQGQVA